MAGMLYNITPALYGNALVISPLQSTVRGGPMHASSKPGHRAAVRLDHPPTALTSCPPLTAAGCPSPPA